MGWIFFVRLHGNNKTTCGAMIPGSLGKKKQNKMKLKIKGRGLEKAEFFWWGGLKWLEVDRHPTMQQQQK